MDTKRHELNIQLAQMLKGGVIMDVTNVEQAKIAEEAGAVSVMALERVPADIRAQGGVARMSDPEMIAQIKEAVSIPVMAKARIGHFVEAQVLEALKIDYIDESEVLTPADEECHIDKSQFSIPFVCGYQEEEPRPSEPQCELPAPTFCAVLQKPAVQATFRMLRSKRRVLSN